MDADPGKDVQMSPNVVPGKRRERRLSDEEQRAIAEAIAAGKVTKVAEHPDAVAAIASPAAGPYLGPRPPRGVR